MEAFFFHWTGNHKFCDENCEKYIYIYFKKDSELGKKIKTIINSLKQSSGKYAKMIRTNINESFHNVITTITPKRKDFRTSYNSRTKLATLYFNDGFEEIKGIFKELNLKINENLIFVKKFFFGSIFYHFFTFFFLLVCVYLNLKNKKKNGKKIKPKKKFFTYYIYD